MPSPITQSDMEAVFIVTDELGIHREAITVPLGKRDPGGVRRLGPNQLQITLPESAEAARWCGEVLKAELGRLGYEELP
jgi:hypothetical protein